MKKNNIFIIERVLKSSKKISSCEFYSNELLAIEKLKMIQKNNEALPDFIILDFDMPIMNGLEFLMNIRDIKDINKIPIFMNSSTIELDEYFDFLKYENVKWSLLKPFSGQSLQTILDYFEIN